jgi:hypothetical protein
MMKNYDEYTHSDIISYGLNTFLVMSTDYFTYLKAEIDLLSEIDFTDELKSYARQFCEIAMPSIGQSTPSRQVPENYFDDASFFEAWRTLFIHLEKMGYAKVFLHWFNHLMIIREHFAPRLRSWWTDILLYWHKFKQIDSGPNLPQLTSQQITILLLHERVRNFEWCCKPRLWIESDKDIWSIYILKSSRMSVTIRNHGLLKMWVEIFKLLNNDELIELDGWGKAVLDKLNEDEYFSLIQLAQDLKTYGY